MKHRCALLGAAIIAVLCWSACSSDSESAADGSPGGSGADAAGDLSGAADAALDAGAVDAASPGDQGLTLDMPPSPGCEGNRVFVAGGVVCRLSCDAAVACKKLDDGSAIGPSWTDIDLLVVGLEAAGKPILVARRASGEVIAHNVVARTDEVLPLKDVDQLAAGFAHFCARHKSGEVSCWGKQTKGQLGQGKITDVVPASAPITLAEKGVVKLAAGGASTCVMAADGTVRCAGTLSKDKTNRSFTRVSALDGAARLYMGGTGFSSGACGQAASGRLTCTHKMFTFPDDKVVSDVAVADAAACAVTGVDLHCEGFAYDEIAMAEVAATPANLPDVARVATDSTDWCAVTMKGHIVCWGGMMWTPTTKAYWP